MYGKAFASMFKGSMVGSGSDVFAVWAYVISNMVPDGVVGAQVELNAKLLASAIGETEADMQKAIDFLCQPDPISRTPDEDGRRLVQLGPFDYRVVNGAKYMAIRNEEERRERNRQRQAEHRAKLKEKTVKPKGKKKAAPPPPADLGTDTFGESQVKKPEYQTPPVPPESEPPPPEPARA